MESQAVAQGVVRIMTDNQGYGDLDAHGNPKLETPHIDRLAREAVQFQFFYVSPVCSPTRASLLTGRYHYRTGVVDTYLGPALAFIRTHRRQPFFTYLAFNAPHTPLEVGWRGGSHRTTAASACST